MSFKETLARDCDEDAADVAAALRTAIERRVDGIRNGTGHWPELEEVLAELDLCEAELVDDADDNGDDDPAEAEAAWAAEIQLRVDEIRSGKTKTYAAEDVIAAMRLRFESIAGGKRFKDIR
ncbi:MAG TPA: addiction module protein [Longimicrobium sp.]|nr:addiction module protein [Longimicrobium sp.]